MAVRMLQVPKGAKGRLDTFLVKALPAFPVAAVRRMLEAKQVRVNGTLAKVDRRLFGGESVELQLPAPRALEKVAGPTLTVLAHDEAFLIVDKPAGLVVEPEPNQVSLFELAASQLTGFDVGGLAGPGIAHRLDKDTTGCIALARHDDALARLKAAFEAKLVDKVYVGLAHGHTPDTQSLDTPYTKDPQNPRRYTTRVDSPRRARLTYRTLERFEGVSLVEVTLDTGRTHQIRAQLADLGHPLVGDPNYGAPATTLIGRVALHAQHLKIGGQPPLEATAPLPADFTRALEQLRAMGKGS
jgi:23S rRNA pseudouridine1911/1915/1917 synthase